MAEGSDIKLKLEAENPEKLVDALFDDEYFEESKITERERQNREYKKSLLRSSMRRPESGKDHAEEEGVVAK